MEKVQKRNGISLIVLVITILVMIILAGVVVVTMSENNPIEKAKYAKEINNLATLKEEFELYKANRISAGDSFASIQLSFTEAKKDFAYVVKEFADFVNVTNGKLGIRYEKLTEAGRKYAKENNIYNASDKVLPDADVYVETLSDGKKYVTIDAVDYITDVASIYCKNTKEKKYCSSTEKILVNVDETYRQGAGVHVTEELRNFFGNATKVDLLTDENAANANVIVNYGSAWNGIKEGTDAERVMLDRLNKADKNNPCVIVTSGNDTFSSNPYNPLFVANMDERTNLITRNKVADNVITRMLDTVPQDILVNSKDTRMAISFKESPFITNYYTNTAVPQKTADTGMYLEKEKGKAWMHMHTCGQYYNADNVRKVSNAFIAAITKATGTRSMSVLASAAPGTTYTFVVTDYAGNEKEFSVTI